MAYQIKGRVIHIYPTKISASGFASREFVIETAEQYPQKVKLQVIKDSCDLLDSTTINDIVDVSFNVRGASYPESKQEVKDGQIIKIPTGETAYFTSLQVWKFEVTGRDESYELVQTKQDANKATENIAKVYNSVPEPSPAPIQSNDDDDLPF